ncbi:hypothetical protein BH20VER3_BH20VER3_17490 [soil metagenome]
MLLLVSQPRADISLPAPPPPQADNDTAQVQRGGRGTIPLLGHGSSSLRFSILQPPEHGTLSNLRLLSDNRAAVDYQHDGLESSEGDQFSYTVRTSGNRISEPAGVRISIEEPPARMRLPPRLDFGEINAGESQLRPLRIANEGGGRLEGDIRASAPWRAARANYHVGPGESTTINIAFRPNECRNYVGRLTLTAADGTERIVPLAGRAVSPLEIEPDRLEIDAGKRRSGSPDGSFILTNRTNRQLALKFQTGPHFQSLPEVVLGPGERREMMVELSPDRAALPREEITISGDGFDLLLPVEVSVPRQAAVDSATPASSSAVAAAANATPPVERKAVSAESASELPSARIDRSIAPVDAKRLAGADWQLRWPKDDASPVGFRIEERFLSLDEAGDLQTSWRPLASPDVAIAGDSVIAKIGGLDPKQQHMVRVIALAPDGTNLRESSLIPLSPRAEPSHRTRGWLLVLGCALGLLLLLRWRLQRGQGLFA